MAHAQTTEIEIPRPSLWSMAREAGGLFEIAGLARRAGELRRAPSGDGSPVVVMPGFGADDRSTWVLRRYLDELGYDARGWGLGRNAGDVPAMLERVNELVGDLHGQYGERVSLVGWSLGGYLARECARDLPDAVRRVVTLGSPVIGGPKYTTVGGMANRLDWDLDTIETEVARRKEVPLRVPVTAIFSRRDGIVAWQACVDDEAGGPIEHVEVEATHLGLGFSADVYQIVAHRLAEAPSERVV